MRGVRIDLESLVGAAALCSVAFFVLYPILLIVLNSFQVARPGAAQYSFEGRRADVPPFDPKTAMKPGRTYSNTQAEDMLGQRRRIQELTTEIIK